MKREEALAKFCEEEQNYIDGIKAGFLVKIQENANDIADCLQKVFSDIRTAVEEKGKKDIMFIHFSILRIDFLNHIYRFLAQVMDARWYMDTAPVGGAFFFGDAIIHSCGEIVSLHLLRQGKNWNWIVKSIWEKSTVTI